MNVLLQSHSLGLLSADNRPSSPLDFKAVVLPWGAIARRPDPCVVTSLRRTFQLSPGRLGLLGHLH